MAFLILVIGDLHIPDRALDIPLKVRPSILPPPYEAPYHVHHPTIQHHNTSFSVSPSPTC